MNKTVLFGTSLALALATAACQDQPTAPSIQPEERVAGLVSSMEPLAVRPTTAVPLQLPAGAHVADHDFGNLVNQAINPGDYVCSPTQLNSYFLDAVYSFIDAEPAIFNLLYNVLWAEQVPQYEAVYLLTDDTPQIFGYTGQFTNVLNRTHKASKRFWDIDSEEIQLLAMKGSMLLDVDRVAAVYQLGIGPLPPYNQTPAVAYAVAELIRDAVASSTELDGGNHPLFSLNAFAVSAPGFLPDKIIMGDAILAFYEDLGFEDVAPQAIYAHEFAHHVQFDNNYRLNQPGSTAAERTRYTELMADAMSAFFMTHKRGAAMNKHRVAQFLEVFYEIGDCSFTSSGHHGTPNQRMAAAQWGFDLADAAQKQGHLLTAAEFNALWLEAYPVLIAPDAP